MSDFYAGNGPVKGSARWSRGTRAAAVLGVCLVVGGGSFAAVDAATGSSAAPSAHTQAANIQAVSAQQGTTESAAVLRDVLSAKGIRRLARLRLLGGMYGQFTFKTKTGPRTLAFERGSITSVGGGDIVVRAADGTTFTWVLTGTTVVRENGAKQPETTLAQGETVFAGGPVSGGTRDARLIVIRKTATPQG